MEALIFIGVFWVLPVWVAHRIGRRKGRAGWAWGLLLGWIGVVIVAVLDDKDPHRAGARERLSERDLEIKELEAQIHLEELRRKVERLPELMPETATPVDRVTSPATLNPTLHRPAP